MKTYQLATLCNGSIKALNLPLMSMAEATRHRKALMTLSPDAVVYILNPHAL